MFKPDTIYAVIKRKCQFLFTIYVIKEFIVRNLSRVRKKNCDRARSTCVYLSVRLIIGKLSILHASPTMFVTEKNVT